MLVGAFAASAASALSAETGDGAAEGVPVGVTLGALVPAGGVDSLVLVAVALDGAPGGLVRAGPCPDEVQPTATRHARPAAMVGRRRATDMTAILARARAAGGANRRRTPARAR
jgi:hypothetical protein